MTAQHSDKPDKRDDVAVNMMLMMGLMMGVCIGSVLLFSLAPVIGWPLAAGLGLAGIAAMLFLHQRFMGHGWHR